MKSLKAIYQNYHWTFFYRGEILAGNFQYRLLNLPPHDFLFFWNGHQGYFGKVWPSETNKKYAYLRIISLSLKCPTVVKNWESWKIGYLIRK